MAPRKKWPAKPLRRSERLRLRRLAAEATSGGNEASRIPELGQQEPEQQNQREHQDLQEQPEPEQPRQLRRQKSRAESGVANRCGVATRGGVATIGGVTRRGRGRPRRSVPVTSTPLVEPATQMALFGRFIGGVFQAARESCAGEFAKGQSPIPNPSQNEQPTQSHRLTEELEVTVSVVSSDSDSDGI